MKKLKKSALLGLTFVTASFVAEPAKAIPIPTIGMSELVQNLEMVKQSIDQAKQQFEQIKNGVEQAKNMGGKLSLDGLKGAAQGLQSASKAVTIPPAAQKTGLTNETVKDPAKVRDWVQNLYKQKDEGFDIEERDNCRAASSQLQEENTAASLSESLATQTEIASGSDMKEAQEAVNNSGDQMQMMGASTKILQKILKMKAADTKMKANDTAASAVDGLCR